MASEGLPHLFDRYEVLVGDSAPELRLREYPMGNIVLDFSPD